MTRINVPYDFNRPPDKATGRYRALFGERVARPDLVGMDVLLDAGADEQADPLPGKIAKAYMVTWIEVEPDE